MQWNYTVRLNSRVPETLVKKQVFTYFCGGTEQACREGLRDLNTLCYPVILQAVLHLSESEDAEISYLNMGW